MVSRCAGNISTGGIRIVSVADQIGSGSWQADQTPVVETKRQRTAIVGRHGEWRADGGGIIQIKLSPADQTPTSGWGARKGP